jgi:hypothetical protein
MNTEEDEFNRIEREAAMRTASGPTGIEAMVCADIAKRQRFGMNKYGISVQDNPLALREWLNHAYEEAMDFAVYLRRAIEELDKQGGK